MTQRLRTGAGASTDAHCIDSLTQHDGCSMAQYFFHQAFKVRTGSDFGTLLKLNPRAQYRGAERQVCRPAYLSTAGRLRYRSPDANTFAGRQIKGTFGVDIKRLVPLVKISNHAIDAIIGRAMGAANQLLTKRLFTIF